MEKRKLGTSDLEVSVVGVGCNNFGAPHPRRRRRPRRRAPRARSRHHAVRHRRRLWRRQLRGVPGRDHRQTGARRSCSPPSSAAMSDSARPRGARGATIMRAVEASLKRLRTDWIDLYQVHFPDPKTPIEETLRALDDLVRRARCARSAARTFPAPQLDDAQDAAERAQARGLRHLPGRIQPAGARHRARACPGDAKRAA